MTNEDMKYYKLSYLIHANGGFKKIFLSKQSWDFYLSLLLTVLIVIFNKLPPLTNSEFIFVLGLNIALLGLILATYAIIFSIQDMKYLYALVFTNNYQYLLLQTTWTACWIFASIGLYGFLAGIHFSLILLIPAIFSTIYGFLGTVVIIAQTLRKFAVMAARKTPELQKAWEENDSKLK